jgi:hypothetical protein
MAGEGRPPTTLLCSTKESRGWPAFAGHDTLLSVTGHGARPAGGYGCPEVPTTDYLKEFKDAADFANERRIPFER